MSLLLKGALVSGALIAAIGAQNAFVVRQGISGRFILPVALTCFLCDLVLMTLGVFGVGQLVQANPALTVALALGGSAFLLWHGIRSFRKAFTSTEHLDAGMGQTATSRTAAILGTLGVTLLNPHVYLDTLVIVGGIAGSLGFSDKLNFLAGALASSALWFFGLAYGARALQPLFRQQLAWRVLEFLVGCVMAWIAAGLLWYAWQALH